MKLGYKIVVKLRGKDLNQEEPYKTIRCRICDLYFPSEEVKKIHEQLVHTKQKRALSSLNY